MSKYWSAHTHSKFSAHDALPTVDAIVDKAKQLGYPALGLTDHGTMAGTVQLYTSCKKADIKPLPGIEMYLSFNRQVQRPSTVHMGLLAVTEKGYRNLASLTTQSHQQFKFKPMLDVADLAQAAEDGRLDGIAATSGCWFGAIPTLWRNGGDDAERRTANFAMSLAGWFGSGFYIEIQNHVIVDNEHDDDTHGQVLYNIAQRTGIPILITQDSHYVELPDRAIHETMKRLFSWSKDPEDALFPGDGYHMVDDEWMMDHHLPAIYEAGIEGLDDLQSKAKVRIPELDKFSLKVPDITIKGTPNEDLRSIVTEAMNEQFQTDRIEHSYIETYFNRIEYELDVVTSQNFSGYLLFVAKICQYMRDQKINYNVRGSASGSLLCWLVGITSLDPVLWGLSSDRFLTKDQIKAPDIDIDIEHDRRENVTNWLKDNFHVVNISTWMTMTMNKDEDGESKGSLIVRWKMNARKTGKDPFGAIPLSDKKLMEKLSEKEAYSSYGVHAAGLLVTPDAATAEVVPLQYVASSKTMVTAFDKDDVEKLGLLKVDLLGLKTLTALRKIQEYTGVSLDSIYLEDKRTFTEISKGRTDGLFQLEGYTSNKGVKALRPTKIQDIIAAMALFRPATDKKMVDSYIKRRHGKQSIPKQHPFIYAQTEETYGVLLYQEQVINILKSIGFDASELEKARKLIKATSNDSKEITRVKNHLADLGKKAGMSNFDIKWLKDSLDAYANYGFNKAHATAYGLMAYKTGYYSAHYPLEFWVSMLDVYTGSDKEEDYLLAAEKAGVTILGPHINISGAGYTLDRENKAIRSGLTSIKGLGEKSALEIVKHAPYDSLDDFARKVSGSRVTGAKQLGAGETPQLCKGIIPELYKAGALSGLTREA